MGRTKVSLRSRPISGGRRTLYLEFYPPVRVREIMKMQRYETLGMYVWDKPKTLTQKQYNEAIFAQAEAIRALRVQAVINEEFDFLDKEKIKGDFLAYFHKEATQRNNSWMSCYKHFYQFVDGRCTFRQLTVDLCVRFREYLMNAMQLDDPTKPLSVNSASNYYRKFRGMLAITLRDDYIRENINEHLERIEAKRNRIEFLNFQELYNLSKTSCEIPVLKRASLYACLSGLRISDIMQLTWNNIVPNIKGTGYNMRIRTEKTETEATLPISPDALELCGPRERGLVFKGLTRSMLNKPLKKWLSAAGITKHITFHCFRHTYAVLQLASGTDIYTVSKMLTHKHVTTTEIYLDLLDEMKEDTLGRIQIYKDPEPMVA